jgi:hypothetical protein
MDTESTGPRAAADETLERAIVLQLLREDRERTWSRSELEAELEDDGSETGREIVEAALQRLEGEGVIGACEQAVWASSAARRLDELGLIAV